MEAQKTGNFPEPIRLCGQLKEELESEQSWTKSGKEIKAGVRAKRLVLQGFEEDSRFAIEVIKQFSEKIASLPSDRLIFQNEMGMEIVRVELEGAGILEVGLLEFARRLHLSRKELRKAEKEGKLSEILTEKLKHLQPIQKILEHYQPIFNKYEAAAEGKLVVPGSVPTIESGLTAKELMSIVRVAFTPDTFNAGEEGTFINTSDGEKHLLQLNKESGHLQIVRLSGSVRLGEGSYGKVDRVVDVSSASFKALKIAKQGVSTQKDAIAREDVLNECKILKLFQAKDWKVPGIQERLIEVEVISPPSSEEILIGNMGPEYEKNLYDLIQKIPISKMDPLVRIDGIGQIIFGLAWMYTLEVKHGDIRNKNVFVKVGEPLSIKLDDSTQSTIQLYQFDICDWGGARQFQDLQVDSKAVQDDPLGPMSMTRLPQGDEEKMREYVESKSQLLYQEIHIAHDTFATGAVAYEILAWSSSFFDQPVPVKSLRPVLSKGINVKPLCRPQVGGFCDEKWINFFQNMMEEDPFKRIHPLKAWDAYLENMREESSLLRIPKEILTRYEAWNEKLLIRLHEIENS